jgi:nitrate reductase cytochrome c-type subunit
MKILLGIVLVSLLVLTSCKFEKEADYLAMNEVSNDAYALLQEHPGKRLMENNCYVCHNPKASEEAMVAPPMIAVKMHYLSDDISKDTFVQSFVDFLKEPSEAHSKMPGAIKRFGLMPYQFFPEETVRHIADYVYDNQIEEPEWFAAHYAQMHGDRPKMKNGMGMGKNRAETRPMSQAQPSVTERGMLIARTTKAELGKNLMGQIQKNGVIAALDFCNIQALPITDSMATVHKAHIKRVTDKPRNPQNRANAVEAVHIETFKKQVAAGEEPTPIVTTLGKQVDFYYPIVTNNMCLKCHGTPDKELESTTLAKIKQLYPTDMATGYGENEVRGIWSIQFEQ